MQQPVCFCGIQILLNSILVYRPAGEVYDTLLDPLAVVEKSWKNTWKDLWKSLDSKITEEGVTSSWEYEYSNDHMPASCGSCSLSLCLDIHQFNGQLLVDLSRRSWWAVGAKLSFGFISFQMQTTVIIYPTWFHALHLLTILMKFGMSYHLCGFC